jgi:ribosome-associated translation inhibitor RaiA
VEVIRLTTQFSPPVEVVKRGDIHDTDVEYAMKRIDTVTELIGAPILFVRVRLSREADPHHTRPALAQATLDINGDLIRAHVAADTMTEAVDLLAARLRDQVQHRAERRRRRRVPHRVVQPGEWRHGDVREDRSLFAVVAPDEREVVAHKVFAIDPATPDEAAADMEQLDHDFWLFHDLASDADAVIEHLPEGGYRLQRTTPVNAEAGPVAIELEVAEQAPPTTTLEQAIERLEGGGERFVFFVDAEGGRGHVLYRRYDGHYGLLRPE